MANERSALGIGIDTGGTYTDGVVVDLATSEVLSKCKALTTPHDLRLGIDGALRGLDQSLFKDVSIVALSSTLATNSAVEGKGARVGLLMTVPNPQTFSLPDALPCERAAVISGAHDRHGQETSALDPVAAEKAILSMLEDVDAFAVSSYFSIYNPSHEKDLREIIARLSEKPVVCAHELSGAVGMMERGATASLNARLMPLMRELIAAVETMLQAHGIDAPLMVVKGDGSMASAESCRERPVETVLSGPAASVYGACRLSGLEDALVVDMGGTTSDIAMVVGRSAGLDPRGAKVGGWQTKVQAVDMWTIGLGGDSRISVGAEGSITLGPCRSMPLSLAGMRFSGVADRLRALLALPENKIKEEQRRFYCLLKRPTRVLTRGEHALLDELDGNVLSLAEIRERIGYFVDVDKLHEIGAVLETALTPTDVMHAAGKLDFWDTETANLAVAIVARRLKATPENLIERVREKIHVMLAREMAAKAFHADSAVAEEWNDEYHRFLDRLLTMSGACPMEVALNLRLPVVAVGAPVEAYFPDACRRVNAKLVIPPHAEVANAYGAVTGKVVERAEALVRPLPTPREGYQIVGPARLDEALRLEDAVRMAGEQAGKAAEQMVMSRGGCGVQITFDRDDVTAPLPEGWGDAVLMEVRITATAVGLPAVRQSNEESLRATL